MKMSTKECLKSEIKRAWGNCTLFLRVWSLKFLKKGIRIDHHAKTTASSMCLVRLPRYTRHEKLWP
jgi:hypothetical protein